MVGPAGFELVTNPEYIRGCSHPLKNLTKWWAQSDLNQRPSDYESPALTTELWAHVPAIVAPKNRHQQANLPLRFAAKNFEPICQPDGTV
jgi:hypothetical protein